MGFSPCPFASPAKSCFGFGYLACGINVLLILLHFCPLRPKLPIALAITPKFDFVDQFRTMSITLIPIASLIAFYPFIIERVNQPCLVSITILNLAPPRSFSDVWPYLEYMAE